MGINPVFRRICNPLFTPPNRTGSGESTGIAVDNPEFSTFSTGLSTGVFHKGKGVWIFTPGFT